MSTGKFREVVVCGWKSVNAAFTHHPKTIQRLFFDADMSPRTGPFCRYLAQERRIYRQVSNEELSRVAGTVHHGGIVAVTERPTLRAPKFSEIVDWQRDGEPLIVLDRIGNPHNLGAIARTAAFFGIRRMVIPDHPQQGLPTEAAYRVAEGGLEHVRVYRTPALPPFLKQIGDRYLVVGTAVEREGGRHLNLAKPLHAPGRPVALVLGHEEFGMDPKVAKQCEALVHIPGSGDVESLNVAAAAAILIAWLTSGRPARQPARKARRDHTNPENSADALRQHDET